MTDNHEDELEYLFKPFQPVAKSEREVIARLKNCLLALAEHRMMLYDTSIIYAFEASSKYQVGLSLLFID